MLLVIFSCDEKLNEVQLLEIEVMAIHDEVMPKMSDIHQSRKQLQIVLEAGADSTMVFSLLQNLDYADEAMMVWMNDYKPLSADVEDDIKKIFFEEEKVKIINVRDKISGSIDKVNAFVDPILNK